MALPPNNTHRLWIDYETVNAKHSQLWRYKDPVAPGDMMAAIDEFYTTLSSALYQISILGARYAVMGSNITLPVAWTGSAGYGSGSEPAQNAPRFSTFVGRGTDGARWSMQQYGLNLSVPNDYRGVYGAETPVGDAITVLGDMAAEDLLIAISFAPVRVYNYINFNYNDHWVAEARK